MKRPTEVVYIRSSIPRDQVQCKNCKNVLPIGRKPRSIRSVHMRCDQCGETVLVEPKVSE